ncbi:MAG: DUF1189 domain-containing protein [bacterium]|nr:DUF1189 domain-containing protein [bacterium]
MDGKPQGIFNSIPQSCFNFKFYQEIAKQKVWKSILYLSLLLLIVALILTVYYGTKLQQVIYEGNKIAKQYLPEIRIVNGQAQVNVQQPYIVYKDETFIIMIDTTGQYTSIDTIYQGGMLLTQNSLIVKESELVSRIYELSQFPDMVINKQTIEQWTKIAIIVLWIALPIGLYFYQIVVKWLQIFIFSLFTLSLNNTMKTNLKYSQLVNIGIYALTAPVILDLIYVLVGRPNPLFIWLYIIVYAMYLFMAMKNLKAQDNVSQIPFNL